LLSARNIDENSEAGEIEKILNSLEEINQEPTGDTHLDEIKR
jgi:hypothetical protein